MVVHGDAQDAGPQRAQREVWARREQRGTRRGEERDKHHLCSRGNRSWYSGKSRMDALTPEVRAASTQCPPTMPGCGVVGGKANGRGRQTSCEFRDERRNRCASSAGSAGTLDKEPGGYRFSPNAGLAFSTCPSKGQSAVSRMPSPKPSEMGIPLQSMANLNPQHSPPMECESSSDV